MIKLYTTHCPKCKILKKKLDELNIEYDIIEDVDIMLELGMSQVPILEIDGVSLDFTEANNWVNKQKKMED